MHTAFQRLSFFLSAPMRLAFLILSIVCTAAPAVAGISEFNAAVTAGDYKAAAREAAATWPTLDKSRDDIGLIAHEFGFASYVAGEFVAARDFAQFAANHAAPGNAQASARLISSILENTAALRVEKKRVNRDALFDALTQCAQIPGFDLVSVLAGSALVSYDFGEANWEEAQASAKLVAPITAAGGDAYSSQARAYELLAIAAESNREPTAQTLQAFHDLRLRLISDMDTAADDKLAASFTQVYWDVSAWQQATYAYLWSNDRLASRTGSIIGRKSRPRDEFCDCNPEDTELPERVDQILDTPADDEACEKKIVINPPMRFPTRARKQGNIGAVIVELDLDDTGQASNGRLLAAVPQKYFADTVLERISDIKYEPGEEWDPQVCKLGQRNRVITFSFLLGR